MNKKKRDKGFPCQPKSKLSCLANPIQQKKRCIIYLPHELNIKPTSKNLPINFLPSYSNIINIINVYNKSRIIYIFIMIQYKNSRGKRRLPSFLFTHIRINLYKILE